MESLNNIRNIQINNDIRGGGMTIYKDSNVNMVELKKEMCSYPECKNTIFFSVNREFKGKVLGRMCNEEVLNKTTIDEYVQNGIQPSVMYFRKKGSEEIGLEYITKKEIIKPQLWKKEINIERKKRVLAFRLCQQFLGGNDDKMGYCCKHIDKLSMFHDLMGYFKEGISLVGQCLYSFQNCLTNPIKLLPYSDGGIEFFKTFQVVSIFIDVYTKIFLIVEPYKYINTTPVSEKCYSMKQDNMIISPFYKILCSLVRRHFDIDENEFLNMGKFEFSLQKTRFIFNEMIRDLKINQFTNCSNKRCSKKIVDCQISKCKKIDLSKYLEGYYKFEDRFSNNNIVINKNPHTLEYETYTIPIVNYKICEYWFCSSECHDEIKQSIKIIFTEFQNQVQLKRKIIDRINKENKINQFSNKIFNVELGELNIDLYSSLEKLENVCGLKGIKNMIRRYKSYQKKFIEEVGKVITQIFEQSFTWVIERQINILELYISSRRISDEPRNFFGEHLVELTSEDARLCQYVLNLSDLNHMIDDERGRERVLTNYYIKHVELNERNNLRMKLYPIQKLFKHFSNLENTFIRRYKDY